MRFLLPSIVVAGTIAIAATAQTTHAPTVPPVGPAAVSPAQTFTDNCAACHQENGLGIPGAFPALAGDKFVIGSPSAPIAVVLNGRAGMPSFKADLTDAQIAAALTHARSAWGNRAAPITAADVAALRRGEAPKPSDAKPMDAH